MSAIAIRNIHSSDRFALVDAYRAAPLGSPAYRAMVAAHYREGFPESYAPASVDAARALIVAVADGGDVDGAVEAMLGWI